MEKYKIVAKRSGELSETEWHDYTCAFNLVFNKRYSIDFFKDKYFKAFNGSSFHGILFCDTHLVGMFSAIPRRYIYDKKEFIVALACDAFILKEHRKNECFLKQMADAVMLKMGEVDIHHIISIPNTKAYPYWKCYGGWKDIGKLNYHIVPLRISKILGKYQALDILSYLIFKAAILCCSFLPGISDNTINKRIRLQRDSEFIKQRYFSEYQIRKLSGEGYFVYRLYREEKVKAAYLIDCFPLSRRRVYQCLWQIIKENNRNIDVIIFIGVIDKPPIFFLKVPASKEPRVQKFVGLALNNIIGNEFYSIESWDVCLANFDNR